MIGQDGARWFVKGDPTEGALVVVASKGGLKAEETRRAAPRVEEFPFSSERKRMTTIHAMPDGRLVAFMKGAPEVVLSHSFRNALLPVITLTALLFGELLAGAVLTEQIFTIPGFGKLIVDAVFNRDYAVVQGVVLCTAVGFIFMNLLADVVTVLLNPRMRAAI